MPCRRTVQSFKSCSCQTVHIDTFTKPISDCSLFSKIQYVCKLLLSTNFINKNHCRLIRLFAKPDAITFDWYRVISCIYSHLPHNRYGKNKFCKSLFRSTFYKHIGNIAVIPQLHLYYRRWFIFTSKTVQHNYSHIKYWFYDK